MKNLFWKEIKSNQEIYEIILRAVKKLENCVCDTLGPSGRLVMIEKEFGQPLLTKDGVTVAKNVHLKDSFENMVVATMKEIALRTNEEVGDGTTTSISVGSGMVTHVMEKLIEEELNYAPEDTRVKVVDVVKAMKAFSLKFKEKFPNYVRNVNSVQELRSIARISSNSDSEIYDNIVEALLLSGDDGVINIENSPSELTYMEEKKGYGLDCGFLANIFIKGSDIGQVGKFKEPNIIAYNGKLENLRSISPIMGECIQKGRDKRIMIFVKDIAPACIGEMVNMMEAGHANFCVAKMTGIGVEKSAKLEDLGVMCGCEPICDHTTIENMGKSASKYIGSCKVLKIGRKETILEFSDVSDDSDVLKREDRIEKHKEKLIAELNSIEKASARASYERLQKRIANILGSLVVLYVGGRTESEMAEKKHRMEDALNSVKSANRNGVCEGGGIALIKLVSDITDEFRDDERMSNHGFKHGIESCCDGLTKPFLRLCENVGDEQAISRAEEILSGGIEGYDPVTKKVDNMFNLEILDPSDVIMNAVLNSVSAAMTLVNISSAIAFNDDFSIFEHPELAGGVL